MKQFLLLLFSFSFIGIYDQNNEKNEVALVWQPFLLYLCTLFEAFSNGFLLFRPLFNVNPKNYES